MDEFIFGTELVGLKVFDTRGRKIGRVKDAALVPLIDATRVDRFLVGGGWAWLAVRYDQVRSISLRGIYLKEEKLTPYHSDEYMLRLVRDLFDQQIIDALGRKVVRVNDVTFRIREQDDFQSLDVFEIDIGIRSIARRLLQGIVPPTLIRRFQTAIAPNSIPWEYCNIVEPDPQRRLRLNISNTALERMHPADLAEIVEELSPQDRETLIETIDTEVAAEALSEMDPEVQASILESLETEKAAEIIEEMSPDEAAHALAELEEATSSEILEEMTEEAANEVSEILEYKDHTAGFLMKSQFVALSDTATVAGAIERLRAQEEGTEGLTTVFLVDAEDRLLAAIPLVQLFLATGDRLLRELAEDKLVKVPEKETEDRVIALFDKYDLFTLPVVDAAGKLIGVITADSIISVLRRS